MKMFLTATFIIQLASAKTKIESGTISGLAKHYVHSMRQNSHSEIYSFKTGIDKQGIKL